MDSEDKDVQNLCEEWDKVRNNGLHNPAAVTLKDVMLMLRHTDEFDGLHEMLLAAMKPVVEEIVQPLHGAQYAHAECVRNSAESQDAKEAATNLQKENARLEEENSKLLQKISTLEENAKKEKAQRESVAQSAMESLEKCERERDHSRKQLAQEQAENKKLCTRLAQVEKECNTARTQLVTAQAVAKQLPTEHLRFVRNDGEMLRLFFPGGLPEDNALAMLGVVAVLAQESTLKRLFDCFSDRCKNGHTIGEQEQALLHAALGWFNIQWPEDKRYSLLQVQPGDTFDFNCHTRIGAQTGERVKKMLLPGLVDGFGEILKKVLVQV